jgi:putative sugar O-methyltransferase
MTTPWRDLLALMLVDLETAAPQHRPTHYWRVCSARLLADLDRHGIERFRALPAPLQHFVPTWRLAGLDPDGPECRELVAAGHRVLPERGPARPALAQFLSGRAQALADWRVYVAGDRDVTPHTRRASESLVGDPVGQFTFDGRRCSRSMLNYLLGLAFAKQHLGPLPVRTVLEIGGGFGTLGEILLADPRNGTCYLDVDIPPTAVFATWYLGQVLGEHRVLDYGRTQTLPELRIDDLRRDVDAAVLCPWQLPRLSGEVDLFVNFISFQEMEPAVVQGYLQQVTRLGVRHVLLRNLREGKEVARGDGLGVREPVRGEDYRRFLPDHDLVASNVLPFGYETPDGFHSELSLFRRR